MLCHEDMIVAAQAHVGHDQVDMTRTATFHLPESMTWEAPDQLGQALRRFLHENHLSAKSVIVGVPARWIVAKNIAVPPTSPDNISSLLEIQAEQAFALSYQDLVFDYSGRISATEPNEVCLAAMQRRRLSQIKTVSKSAGLRLHSVTPYAAAMGVLSSQTAGTLYGIYAQNQHCEFVTAASGRLQQIKHVSKSLNVHDPDVMAVEIRRMLLLAGAARPGKTAQEDDDPASLVLWSDTQETSQTLRRLRTTLGRQMTICEGRDALADLGRVHMGQAGPEYECAAGVLLAQQRDAACIDFLHSRIGVKTKKTASRWVMWLTLAVLAFGIAMGGMLWQWQQDRRAVRTYEQYVSENTETYEAVRTVKDSLALATGWTVGRPKHLDCLRALTLAFPERGDIWVSNLSLKEDATGLITGSAIDRPTVLHVIDKLKQSGRFATVEMPYIHGDGSDGVSYTIQFQFVSND